MYPRAFSFCGRVVKFVGKNPALFGKITLCCNRYRLQLLRLQEITVLGWSGRAVVLGNCQSGASYCRARVGCACCSCGILYTSIYPVLLFFLPFSGRRLEKERNTVSKGSKTIATNIICCKPGYICNIYFLKSSWRAVLWRSRPG